MRDAQQTAVFLANRVAKDCRPHEIVTFGLCDETIQQHSVSSQRAPRVRTVGQADVTQAFSTVCHVRILPIHLGIIFGSGLDSGTFMLVLFTALKILSGIAVDFQDRKDADKSALRAEKTSGKP